MDMLAVFTTVSSEAEADTLARTAIDQHLAACVQVEPIRSTYRWQGSVVSEQELRLMFKTTRERYPALEALLTRLHPYEVPAIFALPVAEASPAYAARLQDSVEPQA